MWPPNTLPLALGDIRFRRASLVLAFCSKPISGVPWGLAIPAGALRSWYGVLGHPFTWYEDMTSWNAERILACENVEQDDSEHGQRQAFGVTGHSFS